AHQRQDVGVTRRPLLSGQGWSEPRHDERQDEETGSNSVQHRISCSTRRHDCTRTCKSALTSSPPLPKPVRNNLESDRTILNVPIPGRGCMRLSTERNRDETRAVAVLHAALEAGTRFSDTADAYCWDEDERGHNERLIARALASWSGDRSRVRVGTKGGLTRPGGRWESDGRGKHLREACEHSLVALGVERLDLYQLHAPDPRTPLAPSVRALEQLQRGGLVDAIGLCNVTVGQIEEARRIVLIESVQVEVSVWHDHHFLSGVVDYCLANRLRLLAYRPLGGPSRRHKTASDPTLAATAARH